MKRKPNSQEALDSARYRMTEFGMRYGTQRTYKAWKALHDAGVTLQVEYRGTRVVDEVGGRLCHVLTRYCNPPEEEGMTDITLFIDDATWFQVGTILKDHDELIGEYYFRDINMNPTFEPKQFEPEILKQY